jgi:hypothetical protein
MNAVILVFVCFGFSWHQHKICFGYFYISFVKLLSEITLIKFSSLGEVERTAVQLVQ